MRRLLILLLFIIPAPSFSPTSLNISPQYDFYLRGETIEVSGTLLTQSGDPISGVSLEIYINGSYYDEVTTDDQGVFSVSIEIPVSRPAGTKMNITAYFPGSGFYLPSSDSVLIDVYAAVSSDVEFNTGGLSVDIEYEPGVTLYVLYSFRYDNDSEAIVDLYVEESITSPTGESSQTLSINDTSSGSIPISPSSPLYDRIRITAYLSDENAFFESSRSKSLSLDLDLTASEDVNVTLRTEGSEVGSPATVEIYACDEYGYSSYIRDIISSGTVRLVMSGRYLSATSSNVEAINDTCVYALYEFNSTPPSRGGSLRAIASFPRPNFLKIHTNSSFAMIPVTDLEARGIPDRVPRGVAVEFLPQLYNPYTNDTRPLRTYGDIEVIGDYLDARRVENRFVLVALSDVQLNLTASASSENVYFDFSQLVDVSAVEVSVEASANDTSVRIHRNETYTFTLNITPREFDVDAIAIVNITTPEGSTKRAMRFQGSLELNFSGDEVLNGTIVYIRVGVRTVSFTIYIYKIATTPISPPGEPASSGSKLQTIVYDIIIAILIGIILFLLYTIAKIVRERYVGRKKAPTVPPHERIIQRMRSLYNIENYKALAIEAYKFLTTIIAPRVGVSIKQNDTPRRVAEKLIAAGVPSSPVTEIVNAYEIARYSNRDISEEAAKSIIASVSVLAKEYLKPETAKRRFLCSKR